ncbi:hypothetical protein [Roseixanthobacter liquoris]|uniref:hypothetical protein n=1 Tax=Roseixanthobacter liquoris TaxID=3119921 RepID=UPI00372A6EB4
MSFNRARAAGINFRSENARNSALFHRASDGVSQYEHLQSPADEAHRARLRQGLRLTIVEIGQARRNAGRYLPTHKRVRGQQRR